MFENEYRKKEIGVRKVFGSSTREIRMNNGCHDSKTITFYPGGTLESSKYKASQSSDGVDKTSVRYILRQAGYSDSEISSAFKAKYDGPMFADRPSGSSLEGYVFGETYQFMGDATAKDVLQTVFDQVFDLVRFSWK